MFLLVHTIHVSLGIHPSTKKNKYKKVKQVNTTTIQNGYIYLRSNLSVQYSTEILLGFPKKK